MKFKTTVENVIKDYTLNVNNYNQQNILKETMAIANMFLNLLYMEKNSCQRQPDMGIDIKSRMHVVDKPEKIMAINNDIRNQCMTYLPDVMEDISLVLENSKGDLKIETSIKGGNPVNFIIGKSDPEKIMIELPDTN